MIALRRHRLDTPIGVLLVVSDPAGTLRGADWADHADRLDRLLRRYLPAGHSCTDTPGVTPATEALAAYFAGDLAAIDGLAVAPGGTLFQQAAWAALRALPPGTPATYGALAAQLGRPAASRAVGAANAANPVSVVIPCHRLVGAGGGLTGYGGGLARKDWLLAHERNHAGRAGVLSPTQT